LVLVDTSVWVDHLRRGDAALAALLESDAVLVHPMVIGEIACCSLRDRALVLGLLDSLPLTTVAQTHEVLGFIEKKHLFGKGIGFIDAHLLASTALGDASVLWTRDKRLFAVARDLGLAYETSSH
jgi:predicted nucleic acid-binding protein